MKYFCVYKINMRYHFLNADLSKNCDTATSEMSKSRDIQGRVSCVMCDVLIRFVVVWNYRGHSPSPHLPASQVSTMFVRFVSHVQVARVSIGDTFFLQRRGFLETIMASHRFYELLHPQNVTHIMNNKDHKVAPCLQKIQPFS